MPLSRDVMEAIQRDVDKKRINKNPWKDEYVSLATSAFDIQNKDEQGAGITRAHIDQISTQLRLRAALISSQINTLSKDAGKINNCKNPASRKVKDGDQNENFRNSAVHLEDLQIEKSIADKVALYFQIGSPDPPSLCDLLGEEFLDYAKKILPEIEIIGSDSNVQALSDESHNFDEYDTESFDYDEIFQSVTTQADSGMLFSFIKFILPFTLPQDDSSEYSSTCKGINKHGLNPSGINELDIQMNVNESEQSTLTEDTQITPHQVTETHSNNYKTPIKRSNEFQDLKDVTNNIKCIRNSVDEFISDHKRKCTAKKRTRTSGIEETDKTYKPPFVLSISAARQYMKNLRRANSVALQQKNLKNIGIRKINTSSLAAEPLMLSNVMPQSRGFQSLVVTKSVSDDSVLGRLGDILLSTEKGTYKPPLNIAKLRSLAEKSHPRNLPICTESLNTEIDFMASDDDVSITSYKEQSLDTSKRNSISADTCIQHNSSIKYSNQLNVDACIQNNESSDSDREPILYLDDGIDSDHMESFTPQFNLKTPIANYKNFGKINSNDIHPNMSTKVLASTPQRVSFATQSVIKQLKNVFSHVSNPFESGSNSTVVNICDKEIYPGTAAHRVAALVLSVNEENSRGGSQKKLHVQKAYHSDDSVSLSIQVENLSL